MTTGALRHRQQRRLFALCAAVFLPLAGCGASLKQDALLLSMEQGTAPAIVDVRSRGEYDQGHLPGAVQVPFYAVRSGLAERGISADDPVMLYCEHGPRAGIAGLILSLAGYGSVLSLEGHMKSWREHEYPIEVRSR